MLVSLATRVAATRTAFVMAVLFALAPVLLLGAACLIQFQSSYFPVVRDFTVESAEVDEEGDVVLSGYFYKNYDDRVMQFESLHWFMLDKHRGEDAKFFVDATYLDVKKKAEDNNRQKGFQRFYGWKIGVSEFPDVRQYSGFVKHKFLGVIPTRTNLPVLPSPELEVVVEHPGGRS